MKFFFVYLLGLGASGAVQGRNLDAAEDLRVRWHMDEPNITYFSDNNTFVLDFPTASVLNNASLGGMEEEFYDINCRDDGSGFVEYVIPEGITAPDGLSPPAMQNGPDGKPQLQFVINTTVLANDPNIFTIIDPSMVGSRRGLSEYGGFGAPPPMARGVRRDLSGSCDAEEIVATPTSPPVPTNPPTDPPTRNPTNPPTKNPTARPSDSPSAAPVVAPTNPPTKNPTARPSDSPSAAPAVVPTPASCACEAGDTADQSWKCGNHVYVCPGVTQICSTQGSQQSTYYELTQNQCNLMKAIALNQKCIALPQYGITNPKSLSNRVCYHNINGVLTGYKEDGTCDTCGNFITPGFQAESSESPTESPNPVFQCTRQFFADNGDSPGCNTQPYPQTCMINGGCGDVPANSYFPDLTNKNSYCKCTGNGSPGRYERVHPASLCWDSFMQAGLNYLPGNNADGVAYGNGGLYGTKGGGPTWCTSVSAKGKQRPPYPGYRRGRNLVEFPNDDISKGLIDPLLKNDNESNHKRGRSLVEYTADDVGKGVMRMCVRSSLGYGGTANDTMTLQEQITAGFKEVNFIESLITIFYDLTAGFCVLSFNVEPKERLETTASKDTYGLEAWLCNRTEWQTRSYANAPDRTMPAPIADGYTNITDNPDDNPQAQYFNQGALITVCVAPDDPAWIDGVRMNGITEFDWLRNDLNTTAGNSILDGTPDSVAGDYLMYSSPLQILQEAISSGGEASNMLTSYLPANCLGGAVYCEFSSILFADFYLARGVVSGSGSANLQFANITRRRLREDGEEEEYYYNYEEEVSDEQRRLQESEAPFDLSVPVTGIDDGPGALRTAGGASFGFAALVSSSTMALIVAAFLA